MLQYITIYYDNAAWEMNAADAWRIFILAKDECFDE